MNLPIAVRLSQTLAMMALLSLCCIPKAFAQGDPSLIGELIWSDDFNAFQDAVWTHEVGDGCDKNICSWGNNERQYYAAENTSIESTPNDPDPSNTSLVIEARQEFRGNRDYTSARIISKNKISVLYGMLEVRMMVPDLDHGLWPAAWLLGDGATSWPQQGEIDMMEMGHSQHDREFNFCADVTTNQFVGSNIFHYAEGACNPDNATCAANYAWRESLNAPSNISPYCPEHSLDNRFVKYRLYWTPTSLDISIVDEVEGIEHSLINTFNIDATNPDIATFNEPFYLLLNMAVGGNLPGLPIFEPQNPVTAPTPGKMYVDYIHLHEYAGYGEVILGDGAEPVEEPLSGTVGVFTDRTDLDNYITPGTGSSVLVWGDTLIAGPVEPAYEGSNLISWQTEPSKGWFGAGIAAGAAKNFSNYTGGTLNFSMKVPADLSFKVGVISNAGENWI
ncbi:MAG: beta-glucanase (GH16 family), partial [Flavobacteriales bacterium]